PCPGSSAGGDWSLGHAAANVAVIIPVGALLCSSAAALREYSVMTNSSDTSFVRCQPGTNASSPGSSMTTLNFGLPVLGSLTRLNAYMLMPSMVSVTAAS